METQNTVVGNWITVGQSVYRINDENGNSDLICIAVSKGIAEIIADKFNGNLPKTIGELEQQGKIKPVY
jgi:hypothetical protein